jgi:hypothetical protein
MIPFALPIAEGDSNGNLLWVAVFVAGIVVAAWAIRRHAKKSRILDDPRAPESAETDLRRSMDRLLVELRETSREINATIDTKIVALNKLVEDADRRIETLKSLEKKPAAPATAEPPKPAPEESSRRTVLEAEVARLAAQGKTELEIARATGVPRGEIELMLSLRRTRETEGGPRA